MRVLKIRIKSMICLVVVKADKGNTVVILKRTEYYVTKMLNKLSN